MKIEKIDIFADITENPELVIDKINEMVEAVNDLIKREFEPEEEENIQIQPIGTYKPQPQAYITGTGGGSSGGGGWGTSFSQCCDCSGCSHIGNGSCSFCQQHQVYRNLAKLKAFNSSQNGNSGATLSSGTV